MVCKCCQFDQDTNFVVKDLIYLSDDNFRLAQTERICRQEIDIAQMTGFMFNGLKKVFF